MLEKFLPHWAKFSEGIGREQNSNKDTNMKKQIDPTIKAHLIRSAFYVLLFLAVCVIPFALAQSPNRGSPISPTARLSGSTSLSYVGTTNGSPTDSALWYNGDFDGRNGLANERNTIVSQAAVYDNFVVTSAGGWIVTSVFSDNLISTIVTGATWEIRSGVSAGNGGTLVASGFTVTPVVTPTGRSGFGFTEFMVEVTGVQVFLLPGTYWLNVTPVGNGGGRSFDSTTSGTNCVGTPCGNDNNSFFDSTFFGFVFAPADGVIGLSPVDFSMGVNGIVLGRSSPTPRPFPTPPPR
jgi:hypothetical protein